MERAVGIDLGTTNTLVATIENGRVKIIPNAEGQRLTPSVVGYPRGQGPLVGQVAREMAAAHPEETVFSIKRLMGSDQKVRLGGKERTPQEISGAILCKVKTDAEAHLGERIDRAVITVPAYFNDRQRHATLEAAALAGLEVMRIINEPTAAALAYGLEREDVHTVLVWDLGGGTFDVSVLELGEGIFEVRAVGGDTLLGGDDFDARVTQFVIERYQQVYGGKFSGGPQARYRLRQAAEAARIQLSSSPVATVDLSFLDPHGFGRRKIEITRDRLRVLASDLLERMYAATRRVLADAGLTAGDIDRVILAGGATRMPIVRDLVREVVGKEPYRHIDPDEVVAAGAAIRSGMLLGIVGKAVLLDVLPLSVGVQTQGGLTARIIARNTPLPASGTRVFSTAADYQTSMDLHVLQGERELAIDNVSLGSFELDGIPAAPRGVAKVEVAFQADVDGIIHVSAKELLMDEKAAALTVTSITKSLARLEIKDLVREAAQSAEQDRDDSDRIRARIEAENLMDSAAMVVEESAGTQPDARGEDIVTAASDLRGMLDTAATERLKAGNRRLRRLLMAMPADESRAAGPVNHRQTPP